MCQIITPFSDKGNHKEHRRIVFFLFTKLVLDKKYFEISVRTKTNYFANDKQRRIMSRGYLLNFLGCITNWNKDG